MLTNPLDFTNTGTMPINGGAATATNGDTAFNAAAKFGGVNYKTGINPLLLLVTVVAVGLVVSVVVNRA